jgi:hypothetical protein
MKRIRRAESSFVAPAEASVSRYQRRPACPSPAHHEMKPRLDQLVGLPSLVHPFAMPSGNGRYLRTADGRWVVFAWLESRHCEP